MNQDFLARMAERDQKATKDRPATTACPGGRERRETTAHRATPNKDPKVLRVTRVSPETKDLPVAVVPLERAENAATMDVLARRVLEDGLARARAQDRRACRVFWV